MSRKLLWGLLAVPPIAMLAVSFVIPKQSAAPSPVVDMVPSQSAMDAALRAIREEPKVKDVLYQPGQAVEWQVGVLDDGSSRVGYANYICDLLNEHGALRPSTQVRIVDIAKVAQGTGFRASSLGHIACADRRIISP